MYPVAYVSDADISQQAVTAIIAVKVIIEIQQKPLHIAKHAKVSANPIL